MWEDHNNMGVTNNNTCMWEARQKFGAFHAHLGLIGIEINTQTIRC